MKEIENDRISIIVKACDDKKAFNIKVLDISKLSSIADYFIIVSGNSSTQVSAISDYVDEKMRESGYSLYRKEGYKGGHWILLDYGDIVVHIFHREDREFYDLERLWVDSKEIDLNDIINK